MTNKLKSKVAGHLDPNENFFVQNGSLPASARTNKPGNELIECKMISDNNGSTKSKVLETGKVWFPLFQELVKVKDS